MGGQGYFHYLGAYILIDLEALRFPEIGAFPRFTDDRDLQVMVTGPDITGIDELHPPFCRASNSLNV